MIATVRRSEHATAASSPLLLAVEPAGATSVLGSCLTFPTEDLYKCLKRVLVYLLRTPNLGITFTGHSANAKKLRVMADSNWSV